MRRAEKRIEATPPRCPRCGRDETRLERCYGAECGRWWCTLCGAKWPVETRGMKRYPVGSEVIARWSPDDSDEIRERIATVIRHGRDAGGIYTEVEFRDDGSRCEMHRDSLRPAP